MNTTSGDNCSWRVVRSLFVVAMFAIVSSPYVGGDVILQSDSRAQFGDFSFAYFFIEAEDFHNNNPRGDGASWLLSSDEMSLSQTVQAESEPDPGAFASGGESITNAIEQSVTNENVGGGHDIQYLVQFDTPGSYYLYVRQHSPLGPENDRNRNDSFFTPVDFGEDPIQNKANGDDYGLLESISTPGDTFRRGPWVWFATRNPVENSEQNPPLDQNPATFLEWDIPPNMVGQNLILEFDHRETGTMLDAFLFVETTGGLPPTDGRGQLGTGFDGVGDVVDLVFRLPNLGMLFCDFDDNQVCNDIDIDLISAAVREGNQESRFDVNIDGTVDNTDRLLVIEDRTVGIGTLVGDANLDFSVDALDFDSWMTNRFTNGTTWASGDFNGDGATDGSDFGEWNDRKFTSANAAVPEPSTFWLLAVAFLSLGRVLKNKSPSRMREGRTR